MAYSGLSQFIKVLDESGELLRVQTFVDPYLEITELTDRISKTADGGKALLFENTGTSFPVLINAFGSKKRIALALGLDDLEEVGEEIVGLIGKVTAPRENILQKLSLLPLLSKISSWMPGKVSGRANCQDVVLKPGDLTRLPVLTCWPHDGGPFVTLPMVITKDPETGNRNVGMYRLQVFGANLTGMHWHKHKTGARHFDKYKALDKKMPIAVALGGDPSFIYAATAPLPENMDEFILAGFLRKKRVDMVQAITQDIQVPADADIIIEGYVDPKEAFIKEGPFGDHTGFYSLEDMYPKFHVTCITHRRNAVYPATIVGIPPQEDAYIGMATERIFLSPMKMSVAPEILDIALPPEGVAHNLILVQIKKDYAGQAVKVANALWGAGQMMFNKIAVITTEQLDTSKYLEFLQKTMVRFNPKKDIYFGYGPLDVLDHASDEPAEGGKMCIDLTSEIEPGKVETFFFPETDMMKKHAQIVHVNDQLMKKNVPILFLTLKQDKYQNHRAVLFDIFSEPGNSLPKIIIIFDEKVHTSEISLLVWLSLSNIDPARDCYIEDFNNHAILVVDASSKYHKKEFKREWPNIVSSSAETIEKVDKRWDEYKIGEFIPSPSNSIKPLIPNRGATVEKNNTV